MERIKDVTVCGRELIYNGKTYLAIRAAVEILNYTSFSALRRGCEHNVIEHIALPVKNRIQYYISADEITKILRSI